MLYTKRSGGKRTIDAICDLLEYVLGCGASCELLVTTKHRPSILLFSLYFGRWASRILILDIILKDILKLQGLTIFESDLGEARLTGTVSLPWSCMRC